MAGANFARLTTWVKQRLKYAALNAEFNNILNNFNPSGMASQSNTLLEMQGAEDPAPYVSGSQVPATATSLASELKRLRYIVARLMGVSSWYVDPGRILSVNPNDLVASLDFNGASASEAYADAIARGLIINAKQLSAADVLSSAFSSAQKKFGDRSLACGSALAAYPNRAPNVLSLSAHFYNLSAGDYIAFNPLLGIELYLDGSGQLTAKLTKRTTSSEVAKATSTVAGGTSRAGATSWQHALMQLRCANAAGSGNDLLNLFRDGSAEGAAVSAADLLASVGRGGNWIIGAKKQDAPWDVFSAMKVTPDTEASGPWTLSDAGTRSAAISSDGVLALTTTGGSFGNFLSYVKTSNINLAAMTIETKAKISTLTNTSAIITAVNDLSMNRTMLVGITTDGRLYVNLGGVVSWVSLPDPDEYHVYRVTSLGATNPVVSVYVDGICVFVGTNSTANTPSGDAIYFGINAAGLPSTDTAVEYEYYAYHGSGASVYSPSAVNASGFIDDFSVAKVIYNAQVITQLISNPAKLVFGGEAKLGLSLEPGERSCKGTSAGAGALGQPIYFASDGKTPIIVALNYSFSSTGAETLTFGAHSDIRTGSGLYYNLARTQRVYPVGLNSLQPSVAASGTVLDARLSASAKAG